VEHGPERAAAESTPGWWIVGSDAWAWLLLILGIAVAVGTPFLSSVSYGADLTWPALATNFSSTLLAFIVALAWDRRQRGVADRKEAALEAQRAASSRQAENERRQLEARRRFAALELELERVEASLRRIAEEGHNFRYFFPDLPTGSWAASSAPLGLIVANYTLMADLSTFYGQVEEMRWRLRFKASNDADADEMSPLVSALARELLRDVSHLSASVARQVEEPEVEPVLASTTSRLVSRRQLTETIRTIDLADARAVGGPPG
jgi:hypothetical protein